MRMEEIMIESPNDLPPIDKQFFGPGYACQLLQVTPGQLKVLLEETGIRFAVMLDNVPLIDGVGMQKLVDKANELRAEIDTAIAKAERAPLN